MKVEIKFTPESESILDPIVKVTLEGDIDMVNEILKCLEKLNYESY